MATRVPDMEDPRRPTLAEFTHTFVPFGLLLSAALLAGEAALDAPRARLNYSVWVAMALLVPALALFILPAATARRERYRRLLWTFSYLAYLVHFYYSVFVHYGGSVGAVFQGQGPLIAGSNFLVTAWWGLDVLLTWWSAGQAGWLRAQRIAFHACLVLAFFMASVVIFRGFVNVLGIAMAVTVVVCLAARIWAGRAVPASAPSSSPLSKAETA